jgi:hypothetical protein
MAYRVRQALIAFRREQAQHILILAEEIPEASTQ